MSAIQSRINPPTPVAAKTDLSAAKVDDPTQVVTNKNAANKTDFKALITNSMDEIKKERKARENGDLSSTSEAEFLEKLAEQTKEKRVPKNELGKDDFLKLFVTQLQNQDPLNPDDGTEMAAKLAQFNGLEQMMNVNKSLEKMLTEQNSARNLQMVNYVGREVTVDGGRTRLKDGVPTKSEFMLETPANGATLEVRDGAGKMVAQVDLGPKDAGTHALTWDGKNGAGRSLPDGVYTYSISARNGEGRDLPVTMTAKVRVTGIDIKSTDGGLFTDFGKISFDQIRSVGKPGFEEESASLGTAPKAASAGPTPPVTEDLERLKAEGKLNLPGLDKAVATQPQAKEEPKPAARVGASKEADPASPAPSKISNEPTKVGAAPTVPQAAAPTPPAQKNQVAAPS